MTKRAIFFVALQLFVFSTLQAQSISEQLGGVKTHFRLYSLTTKLDASEQILILRAENVHHAVDYDESGFGWGAGYRSYHFEFVTQTQLNSQRVVRKVGLARSVELRLTFYDSKGNTLTSVLIPYSRLDQQSVSSEKKNLFFYSIDLINIPLIILDQTDAIDIVRVTAGRN